MTNTTRAAMSLSLAAALVLAPPTSARAAEATTSGSSDTLAPKATFALIIGANRSVDADLAPLKYADDDAARYQDLFRLLGARTTLLARLDDNTRRLHPQADAEALDPKKAAFDAAVTQLAADVAKAAARGVETSLYVVYAGHGNVQNGQGYITLEDARITGADLAAVFARIPATEIHLIADACASYFLAYGRGAGGSRRPVESFAASNDLVADTRVGLLLSTSSARESHEWEAFQSGVFSHEVRSGLYGAADADGDGRVSYREIAAFVARANANVPNERYRPDVHARAPKGGGTLVDLRKARGRRLEINAKHAGHWILEDARGVRILDVHNAPWQSLSVVRPGPTSALYLRRLDDDRELTIPADRDVVTVADLAWKDGRVASRGAAHEAFSAIFSLPFDRLAVDAFHLPSDEDSLAIHDDARSFTTRQKVGLMLAGSGLALAGIGVWGTLSAAAIRDDLTGGTSQLQADAANEQIRTRNAIATIGYVGGAAAVATGAALLLWPEAKGTAAATAVEPLKGGMFFRWATSF